MRTLSELLSFGNRKLPKTTAIFNLGSATECPSKALGLCKLCNVCYAMKAERLYPACLPYRNEQLVYWNNHSASEFATEFLQLIASKRTPVTAIRFNEAGDFYSQADVEKMEQIAWILRNEVKVYVYTARQDLNFSGCYFLQVNASGFDKQGISAQFVGVKDAKAVVKIMRSNDKLGKKFYVCCGDCRKCTLCQHVKHSVILCEIH